MQKEKNVRRTWLVLLLICFVALVAFSTSCNKGLSTERSDSVDGNGLPIVTVTSLAPSDGNIADTLEVSVSDGTDGYDVSIRAGEDTPLLDELFFQVVYDPKSIQAESITVDKSSGDGSTIDLAIEATPGVIEVGIVGTNQTEDVAVRAGDALLSFKLVEGSAGKDVSSANENHLSRPRNLEFNQNGDGAWELSWDYTNPGDNNQDGEVGVADLTPIAINYGKTVNDSWADPLRHIDGDHNGEINLADITPIAVNYSADVWAYKIQMSEDGIKDFIVVGEFLLNEFSMDAGATQRFTYEFGAQYVEGAWYRVMALNRNLVHGPPSEAISEAGRRIDPIEVQDGGTVTITVNTHDLDPGLQHVNAIRVKFPSGFSYVANSTNPGSVGGSNSFVDGIWASFATSFLWPADMFFEPLDLGDGYQSIDFNVTTLGRTLDGAPIGYGDLFNFKLEGDGTSELTLEFVVTSDDRILRTYYSDLNSDNHEFGNKLGFEIKESGPTSGAAI